MARGRGIGSKIMNKCLNRAKENSFDQCYLEAMPFMKDAKNYIRDLVLNIWRPLLAILVIFLVRFVC